MEYVRLGSAGVKVSRIALGLGFRGQSSVYAARRLIEHAIDSGVNFIDCANFYRVLGGPLSEEVLSPVLRKRRDEVVVTSKVYGHVGPGPNDGGSTRYHILSQVERSLRRLRTDHVDVYLLHQFDDETPVDETVRALDDLVTSGKTRYVGACNFAAWQVCKFLWTADRVGADPLVTIQNPYSLLNRTLEAEMFGLLRDQGLGAMAFSPLGAGLLSGLYTPGEPPPPGSLWASKDPARYERSLSGQGPAIIGTLRAIAADRGKTPGQVALNWVMSKPEITVAISGNDTIEQLDENLGAVGWSLSDEEIARLDRASVGTDVSFVNL